MENTGTLLHIDNREHALLSLIADNGIQVTVLPLPVADIVVSRGDVCILIERKTIDDLVGSIKDNRYNEQKSRLLNERATRGSKVVYIIEGTKASVLAESAILSMILRDQIHVFRTRDVRGTLDCVMGIYKKISKDTFYAGVSAVSVEMSEVSQESPVLFSTQAPRKAGITPATCYLSMLIQIPSISQKTAQSIASVYRDMQSLIVACKEDTLGLATIQTSANRKLGSKKAHTITQFLIH